MQLPTAFEERTRLLLGEEYPAFIKALNETPPTSIRVNDKMNYVPSSQKVAWCESGYYLPERPSFTSDPLFHAGVYYVQEASSMFLQQAINQHFPEAKNILDVCAAPGGKTTLLSQSFDNDTLIVSNEIIHSRVKILAENVIKWGNANVIVTNNEPADFSKLSSFFDTVIVDAPCSGEGLFRKNPAAIQEWSVENVQKCAVRQKKIVQEVWDALKTDGILVYSTCTYNREENEENVFWICKELGAELLNLDVSRWKNITVSDGGYRFYPHKIRGEGFFLSILRKTAKTPIRNYSFKKKETSKTQPISLPSISLKRPENWIFELNNQQLKAYPKNRWK
ncbi:MAG TPA: RsmB/NOP family class I SAM-dependent RNA methyltransferase, partial [Paludibacteraceae bacterium]|nr:RsmB/NOP family class I SAM-dependent RNA methyltransferase [Paludibacteraceae bacterium]